MDDSENEELMQQMALQVFLRRWNRTGNGDGGDSLMLREVPLSSPSLIVSQTMSTQSPSITIRDVRSWERDPNTFKNEGCKRCLCKNSRCLMLYCACFVSGEYCAEGCGCQDCHNKSNNEEMIHGIRQQIESRDPHAFRRNIAKHATESSQNSGQQQMDDSENEELMQQMALQVFLRRWNRTGNGDGGDSLMRREVPLSSPSLIVSQTMSTHSPSITIRDVRSWERDPNTFKKNEGCKRCLCKNSKCLMLYCACFVSGEYCAEGCGCQDCHNKSNNEEMIHGIRQQIESRDPHAFRRNIANHATESSQNSGRLVPISPNIH